MWFLIGVRALPAEPVPRAETDSKRALAAVMAAYGASLPAPAHALGGQPG